MRREHPPYVVVRCDYCADLVSPHRAVEGYADADVLTLPDRDPKAEPGAYARYVVLVPSTYCGPYCAQQGEEAGTRVGGRG